MRYYVICEQNKSPFLITTGDRNSIFKLATILAWVVTVFKDPESRYGDLTYLSPSFHFSSTIDESGLGPAAIMGIPALAHERGLQWRITAEKVSNMSSRPKSCCLPLFKNFIMADGFPVPERGREVGVEISFEAMVSLGRISYSLEMPTGTILKGHSTMLIPTYITSESIQWHFVGSERPGEYISPDLIPDSLKPDMVDFNVDILRRRRGFVGYYKEAYIYAGTKDSRFDQVKLSDAERQPTTLRIGREISPSISSSGMGIFGAGIGAKFMLTKGLW